MKLFLVAAALMLTGSRALPSESGEGVTLDTRAGVKLNQYSSMDDCQHDRNILYHAAPVSGKCYDLDDKTGAFFYHTGGFMQSYTYDNKGCSGTSHKLQRYTGRCVEKGTQRSAKFE